MDDRVEELMKVLERWFTIKEEYEEMILPIQDEPERLFTDELLIKRVSEYAGTFEILIDDVKRAYDAVKAERNSLN